MASPRSSLPTGQRLRGRERWRLANLVALAAWLAPVLAASACGARIEPPDPADLQAARQAAMVFEVRLKTGVLDRLERDEDPVAVYLAYREAAPALLAQISEAGGVSLKRTGFRVRNPANAPDDWEIAKLEEFDFLMQAGLDPETLGMAEIVTEGETRVMRWIRPLVMGESCLVCHGEEVDPRLLDLIEREFPEDEAVGYFAEELGGAYSARKVLE